MKYTIFIERYAQKQIILPLTRQIYLKEFFKRFHQNSTLKSL
jgi:hypothetical protein